MNFLSILLFGSYLSFAQADFTILAAKGSYITDNGLTPNQGTFYDVGETEFNRLYQESANHIIRRECSDCGSTHSDIYYRRTTTPEAFTPWSYMLDNWFNNNNILGTDFTLHSTLDDALNGINGWTFCNYNDPGIGFPRDCGPTGYVPVQWNTFYSGRGGRTVMFSVYTPEPPSMSPTTNPTMDPSMTPTMDPSMYPTVPPSLSGSSSKSSGKSSSKSSQSSESSADTESSVSAESSESSATGECEWVTILSEDIGSFGTDDYRDLNPDGVIIPDVLTIEKYRITYGTDNQIVFTVDDPTAPIFGDSLATDPFMEITIESIGASTTAVDIGSAYFCRAGNSDDGIRPGDTSWGLTRTSDTVRSCGCNTHGWNGEGLYYGGYSSCTVCACWPGGFAGDKSTGQQKGSLPSVGMIFEACVSTTTDTSSESESGEGRPSGKGNSSGKGKQSAEVTTTEEPEAASGGNGGNGARNSDTDSLGMNENESVSVWVPVSIVLCLLLIIGGLFYYKKIYISKKLVKEVENEIDTENQTVIQEQEGTQTTFTE